MEEEEREEEERGGSEGEGEICGCFAIRKQELLYLRIDKEEWNRKEKSRERRRERREEEQKDDWKCKNKI